MSRSHSEPRFNEMLRALLRKQHGLVTSAQAPPDALRYRAKTGELERVLPRVYRSPLFAASPEQRALAAVLWAGDGALASHLTAVVLYGFGAMAEKPHVWVPADRAPSSTRVIVHRGVVAKNDRRLRAGVPITSPARTILDAAGMLDGEDLEALVEDFLHRGLTTPMSIDRCLTANGGKGRAGSGRLRALLADRDPKALESRLEVKVWRMLRRHGLRPARQHEVHIGGALYKLDFAWPALKVAVEAEGFAVHGDHRAFVPDRRRLADLVAAGWSVIPVTWHDCTHAPEAFVAKIKSVLVCAAA